jgi:hypothetical protein
MAGDASIENKRGDHLGMAAGPIWARISSGLR